MNELDAFEDWFQSELRRVSDDEHGVLLSRKLARPVFLAGYRAAETARIQSDFDCYLLAQELKNE